jgi:hypothetical protein
VRFRDIIRPGVGQNRYYLGPKLHRKFFIFNLLLLVTVVIIMVVVIVWFDIAYDLGLPLSLLIMTAFLSVSFVALGMWARYLLFDKVTDYVGWKFLWRRFYKKYEEPDETHKAINALESQPSEENKKKLQSLIDQNK